MTKISLVRTDTLSCEPVVRRMNDGSLLMVAQCGDTYEPAPRNRVYCFHSYDDGDTWSEPVSIYPEDGQAVYCTEVSVFEDRTVAFLTVHNGQFFNWRSVVMSSTDCGHTWVNEGAFPGLETYTFMRGMIKLRSGDILIPFQHYPVSEEENARIVAKYGGKYRPSGKLTYIGLTDVNIDCVDNGVAISHDGGKSFELYHCKSFPIRGETGLAWVWSEPTIVELSDGRVAMLVRVTKDVLWYCESADGGRSWSDFVRTDIPNPSCKPKLIALPEGKIALLHDPSSVKRNPFAVWISDDDMKTWGRREVISDFPLNFDYPDGFYENGNLYISIELQRRDVLFIKYPL